MPNFNRIRLKIAGESGQGVNSIGEMLAKAVKRSGYEVFAHREYPSLIKGGFSNYQLEISDKPISSPTTKCDLLLCLSRRSVHTYLRTLEKGGILVHSIEEMDFTPGEQEYIQSQDLQVEWVDIVQLAESAGGLRIMSNMVGTGILAGIIGVDMQVLENLIGEFFGDKPDMLEQNKNCLRSGFEHPIRTETDITLATHLQSNPAISQHMLISGNEAMGLGAIASGVRAFFSYPMTPTSNILSFLARHEKETGMLVKQAEDEIMAAQMTLGAMHAGTRAMVATSGGGFDLMTETISLSGMIECPLVLILGQRPGPATGLPTWTSTGDLNLAIYAGHGEFPRCVMAASNAKTSFKLVGEAMNIAEKYQLPVIVLTEKQVAESLFSVDEFPVVQIDRGLTPNGDGHERYELTDSGVSPRWLPGSEGNTYVANSDEHLSDGTVTENADRAEEMQDKRMRKLDTLKAALPEPELFGEQSGDTLFVGWGSVKNAVIDAMHQDSGISYLHYEYIYPLRAEKLMSIKGNFKRVILVENNFLGQLGQLITQNTGFMFSEKLLKYDGRPLSVEDILEISHSNHVM